MNVYTPSPLPSHEALRLYMRLHRLQGRHMAKRTGLSESQISRLMNGKVLPSLQAAIAIEHATEGFVRTSLWITK